MFCTCRYNMRASYHVLQWIHNRSSDSQSYVSQPEMANMFLRSSSAWIGHSAELPPWMEEPILHGQTKPVTAAADDQLEAKATRPYRPNMGRRRQNHEYDRITAGRLRSWIKTSASSSSPSWITCIWWIAVSVMLLGWSHSVFKPMAQLHAGNQMGKTPMICRNWPKSLFNFL